MQREERRSNSNIIINNKVLLANGLNLGISSSNCPINAQIAYITTIVGGHDKEIVIEVESFAIIVNSANEVKVLSVVPENRNLSRSQSICDQMKTPQRLYYKIVDKRVS